MSTMNPVEAWAPPSARLDPPRLAPGEHGLIVVTIDVPDGCHIQSAQPAEPFLIPTSVEFESLDDLSIGGAIYPQAECVHHEWTPVALSIYRGRVEVSVPVEVATSARPGLLTLTGRVRYQGCTEYTCLPPVERPVEVHVEIVSPSAPAPSR